MSMTPLEIALERIEECRCTRSPELDLSECGLEAIPKQVFELTWLEKLDVSENKITDLSLLSRSLQLQVLECGDNQIRDLSPLHGLAQLQVLDCRSNQISHITLNGLAQLQSLNCGDN